MREWKDRAVSTTIGYALTLGVASLLITGLLIAGGGFLQDQREGTTRTELAVIGEQVSADLSSADRLNYSGVDSIRIQRNLPQRVTGSAYTIELNTATQSHLVLRSAEPEVVVRVDVATRTDLRAGSIGGGSIQVTYDPTTDELVLSNANT
ncbi:hypothetical protein BRC89_10230 [Halobacteriales archaeon QS_4_70_19]|nr:MAG: hypothetical protein BRC89_10230 [Halobacteriales archaeon QS_4_70_19]